jgi:cell division protein FtsQ
MAVLCAAAALPQSSLFTIDRIEVNGAETLDAATVRMLSDLRPGQRLFAVDAAAVATRLAAHPRIASAVVRVRAPHVIIITIVERHPLIALAVGDAFALVDGDLMVVDVGPDEGELVRVVDRTARSGWVRPGTRLSADGAKAALIALDNLPAGLQGDVIKIVVAPGPDLTLVTRGGLEIRAGNPSGLADRLAQVPGLIAALRARRLKVATIDLRYAGSIVVKPVGGGEAR